jgi:hypothetical protein
MPSDQAARRVLDALKRKYITPENMLRHLGMDANLLKDIKPMRHRNIRIRPGAYDGSEGEVSPSEVSPDELIRAIALAFSGMDPRNLQEVVDKLKELTDGGDANAWVETVLGGSAGEEELTTNTDEPPPFPGRPTPGKQPLGMGQDAHRFSSAATESFYARFPGTKRIGFNGLG